MKITKEQLRNIIKEEIENVLSEQPEEEQLEEYYGAGYAYDCGKEADRNGLTGYRRREYMEKCEQRKRADSDRRAEKSMRQAAWREE